RAPSGCRVPGELAGDGPHFAVPQYPSCGGGVSGGVPPDDRRLELGRKGLECFSAQSVARRGGKALLQVEETLHLAHLSFRNTSGNVLGDGDVGGGERDAQKRKLMLHGC